jgi:hypothetical protein
VNVWNLDGVKLCQCSNLLSVFHNFTYDVPKVALSLHLFKRLEASKLGAGVPRWCVSDFGGKNSCDRC